MKKLLLFSTLGILINSTYSQGPTWADDVACIVYSHCTSCHNPKGSAPFSLLDYNTAVSYGPSIKYQVENKQMPPWPVDNNYRKMAHDRSLSDFENYTIVKWLNNGALEGNPANAPAPPVYNNSEVITAPDLVLKMPVYTLPNITEDLYRCFVMPTGLSVQKFITGIEIIPGNKSIVHHAQIFYDTSGISTTLDNNDPKPGYTSAGGIGTNSAVLLGTWVPGSSPIFVPQGMGKLLPSNAKIVVQIHYPEYSSGQTDSTKVNFLFTNATVRNIYDAPVLNHTTSITDGPLYIPKNTTKTFHEEFTVPLDATILSVGPHGHLICKSLKAYAVTPKGDTIHLVNIPEWNFHWQGMYDFQQPIKIPMGSKLYGIASYDNTSDNPENPNSPPKDVSLGESTTDEMMLFYFSYLLYKAGDEKIVIDTATHKPHFNNCVSTFTSIASEEYKAFNIYPNPANSIVNISANNNNNFEVVLYNSIGQLIISDINIKNIDISGLDKGIYYLRIKQGASIYFQLLVKE